MKIIADNGGTELSADRNILNKFNIDFENHIGNTEKIAEYLWKVESFCDMTENTQADDVQKR